MVILFDSTVEPLQQIKLTAPALKGIGLNSSRNRLRFSSSRNKRQYVFHCFPQHDFNALDV